MEAVKEINTPKIPKTHMYACIALSAFAVLFLWGFWESGVYAFGFNYTLFLLGYLLLIRHVLKKSELWTPRSSLWFAPLVVIAISHSLFEEPFIQSIHFLVLPIGIATLCLIGRDGFILSCLSYFEVTIRGYFSWMTGFSEARLSYAPFFSQSKKLEDNKTLRSALTGVGISCALLVFVVIPLLSSADTAFEEMFSIIIDTIINPIIELFETETVVRICLFLFGAIALLAQLISWTKPFQLEIKPKKELDSLTTGIVLSSILAVYLLFIGIQIERIWIDSLPIDFKETERLVKSGFWQLFTLTLLNISMFITAFGRTNKITQRILSVFTIASIFLLMSSAYRMGLYVTFYGFSVEKVFASYTVIYCALLYSFFIYLLVTKKQVNIVQNASLLCLWMYSVASVLPLERAIFRANFALSSMHGSRIDLNDLSMLSSAIAPEVYKHGLYLNDKNQAFQCENLPTNALQSASTPLRIPIEKQLRLGTYRWSHWAFVNSKLVENKAWYEHSLSSILAKVPLQSLKQSLKCCSRKQKQRHGRKGQRSVWKFVCSK